MKNLSHNRETSGRFLPALRQTAASLRSYLFSGFTLWARPKPSLKKKKAIGFDVWNTTALIRAWPVEPLIDVGKSMNIPLDDAALKSRFVDYCNELPITDPREFAENVARAFNGTVSEEAISDIQKIIKIEHDAFAWYRDVAPVFRSLKEAGLGVGLISDTWTFTGPLLKENSGVSETSCSGDDVQGLRQLMPQVQDSLDVVVLSCEEDVQQCKGHVDAKPFKVFAKRMGVECEDCIYVGDNITKDVMGAYNAGMMPILIDRTGSVSAAKKEELRAMGIHCVSSLFELLQLLRVLGIVATRS